MKQKLDEMGKRKCSFKNFDIHPPKNDFSFEKRDWMTVRPNELPSGSNLIMGLNPPFGVNAHLANKFINKALQFKPKLLILIVPQETDRLDGERMNYPYDLIFEDTDLLSGKSFYLPGSIDVNGKQMEDWNVSAPPLYLWSHPDWTSTHKSIAEQKGHLTHMPEKAEFNENLMTEPNPPTECSGKSSMTVDDQCLLNEPEKPLEQGATETGKLDYSGTDIAQKYGSRKSKTHSREGEQETKLEEKRVKEISAEKLSDSHHSDNSSKRFKASNKELQREPPSNPKHRFGSGSRNKKKRARYGKDKEVDRRSKSKDTEDPIGRFSGNTYSKRKGYMRNESPISGGGGLQERDPRENMNIKDPAIGGNNWAHASTHGPDYSFIPQHEHFFAQQREVGYQPFPGVSQTYRRDEVPLYAPPDLAYANQRMNHHLMGNHPVYPSPYSQLGPHVNLSHNHTSTMQRYAPRLDELNHPRTNEPHFVHDPRGPPGSQGFAPGPYGSFPTHGSSGWIQD